LLDFPFGPSGETALDYFDRFLAAPETTEGGPRWESFIKGARGSRLGLYQDVKRTKATGQFSELFTGRALSIFRSVDEYDQGEIFLTRMMPAGDQLFMFGNPKCFP